jgi:hypothetical protein
MGGNRLVKRHIYAASEMDVESNAETLLLFPAAALLDRCDEQRAIHFNQLPWSELSMKFVGPLLSDLLFARQGPGTISPHRELICAPVIAWKLEVSPKR